MGKGAVGDEPDDDPQGCGVEFRGEGDQRQARGHPAGEETDGGVQGTVRGARAGTGGEVLVGVGRVDAGDAEGDGGGGDPGRVAVGVEDAGGRGVCGVDDVGDYVVWDDDAV